MSVLTNLMTYLIIALFFFNLSWNKANAENHIHPNVSYTKIMKTNEFENNNNMLARCVADILETVEYRIHGDVTIITCASDERVKSIIKDMIDRVFQHDLMMSMFLAVPKGVHGYFSLRLIFTDSFESYMKVFQRTSFVPIMQNNKTFFIVILLVPDHSAIPFNQMQKFFHLFHWLSITDINIMVATTNKVDTYTFYPYTYGRCGSTRPVLLHSCSKIGQDFRPKSLFPSKNYNMNLCPFKIVTADLPPFVILKEQFMDEKSLTGIDGEILKVISRKMNFTIALIDQSNDIGGTVYPNGTSTGVYEILRQRRANLALGYCECTPYRLQYYASAKAYYQTSFRLVVKNSEGYSSYEAVFFPFSNTTWIIFLIINIIRIIVLILKRYQYFKYLPIAAPNMLLIIWCFVALTFRTSYESLFYNFMLHQPSKPLPTSFDDLRQQNYKIFTDITSGETAQNISELNDMLIIANTTPYDVLRKFENSTSKQIGVLTNMVTFSYFVQNKPEKLNKYVNLNVGLMDQMFCMYFPYLSDFTDEFNRLVTELDTFGLLQQITKRFISPISLSNTEDFRSRRGHEASSEKILSLHHLKGPFIIFVCLQAIAFGVFILEQLSLKFKLLSRGFSIFIK